MLHLQEEIPSPQVIAERGWVVALIPDFPDSELLERFCLAGGYVPLLAVAVNGDEIDEIREIPCRADELLSFEVTRCYALTLVSKAEKLFLLKDAADRYVIVFGQPSEVSAAVGESIEELDSQFLKWISEAKLKPEEAEPLRNILRAYRAGSTGQS